VHELQAEMNKLKFLLTKILGRTNMKKIYFLVFASVLFFNFVNNFTNAQVNFTRIDAATSGLTTSATNNNMGFSWGDYNNDGYLDLYISDAGAPADLFTNNAGTSFTRSTPTTNGTNNEYGSLWADFNGDGKLDLLFTNGSGGLPYYSIKILNGDGTAALGTDASSTYFPSGFSAGGNLMGIAAGDYDHSGNLSLAMGGLYSAGNVIRLFHNTAGVFTDVTSAALPSTHAVTAYNPAWVDINNDGYPDLWFPDYNGGVGGALLYVNHNGDGTFTVSSGLPSTPNSIASAWADFNNDGAMDLVTFGSDGTVHLYQNNGSGTFTDIASSSLIAGNGNIRAASWGDYDNDGYIDLLVTGSSTLSGTDFGILYHNNKNGTFTAGGGYTGSSLFNQNGVRSSLFVDYNNDGFMDVFLDSYGGSSPYPQNKILLQNGGGNGNHWVGFKPVGRGNNKSAIGARVAVYAKLNGVDQVEQIRDIQAGGAGGMTGGNIWANFGVGSVTTIDKVIVTWPDGNTDQFNNVAVGQYYPITEGATSGSGVLPVELVTFTAKSSGKIVELNWNTATEVKNYGFSIERSQGTSVWTEAGFVKGAGNSNSPKAYSFSEKNLSSGNYAYRLKQIDFDGTTKYSQEVGVTVNAPAGFSLGQNYPNPFNPTTTIEFSLPQKSEVNLSVINMLGQVVKEIASGTFEAGTHSVKLNASDIASGIYMYKLQAGNFTSVKKLVLLK
jgi:hypothetical protein